jgi:hypothetical protein
MQSTADQKVSVVGKLFAKRNEECTFDGHAPCIISFRIASLTVMSRIGWSIVVEAGIDAHQDLIIAEEATFREVGDI